MCSLTTKVKTQGNYTNLALSLEKGRNSWRGMWKNTPTAPAPETLGTKSVSMMLCIVTYVYIKKAFYKAYSVVYSIFILLEAFHNRSFPLPNTKIMVLNFENRFILEYGCKLQEHTSLFRKTIKEKLMKDCVKLHHLPKQRPVSDFGFL